MSSANGTSAKHRTVPALVVVMLGFCLCIAAGMAWFAEFEGKLPPVSSFPVRAASLTQTSHWPGLSPESNRQMLRSCQELMDSAYALTRPTAERARLADHCNALATANIQIAPTSSYAWLLVSMTAAALGDRAGFNSAMQQAQATGALEVWIAQMRVDQTERHLALADEKTLSGHEADLAMLVSSETGLRGIARRYLMKTDFRERVISVVETLPQSVQQRFLRNVRGLAYAR